MIYTLRRLFVIIDNVVEVIIKLLEILVIKVFMVVDCFQFTFGPELDELQLSTMMNK